MQTATDQRQPPVVEDSPVSRSPADDETELSDIESFQALWEQLGTTFLERAEPEELGEFLDQAEIAEVIRIQLSAFVCTGKEIIGVTIGINVEPDCEPDEESIDDQEASDDCGTPYDG